MHEIVYYAPIVIVLLAFLWQNNIFVKPEQLERKHREVLDDIEAKYVSLNAYKEFRQQVISDFEEVKSGINEIKKYLMKRRSED